MKASAGSGKTYNLAKTYIRILLESADPYKYRHVLAVTFTNKATDEMKRRILKELHILATRPRESDYFGDFVPAILPDEGQLQRKSLDCLCHILHDYGAFAVSTIDRFFQQTLKAFSREIGQFASYQVELDRASLVGETVDRVLDNLSPEDRGLLGWLTESAMDSLEHEGRFSLERKIGDVARSLKSDRLRGPLEAAGKTASEMFSRDRLRALRRFCNGYIGTFETQVRETAARVVDILGAAGLSVDDLRKNSSLPKVADYAALKKGAKIAKPSPAFLRDAPDSSAWFTKPNQHYLPCVEESLLPVFTRFAELFEDPFKAYNTAFILRDQIDGLGIARELEEQFELLLKEKNVLSIDDSNTILRDIIDGSDAPFIYEKLGVRYENFLLDEFQDTSAIQWENFRPLIENSEAGGFDNLIVGDIKQSIYRFRGSDWNLMDKQLPAQFPDHEEDPLMGNYRTLREIVAFNNEFFTFAASEKGLDAIYRHVAQEACFKDPAPGSVEVVFKSDAQEEMDELVSTIRDLVSKGALYRDVAVLVRNNIDGARVAGRMIEEGIPVVSDDSLRVKSSALVRLTVSALSLTDAPPALDKKGELKVRVEGYDAWSMGITPPSSYDSLPDLAECLLQEVKERSGLPMDGEVPYVLSFMDYLQDWVSLNGNDLPGFLKAWADEDPKISSPASGDSVRIMTIHKSKGLEFPFVILPFVEKIPFFKADQSDGEGYWCAPELKGTPLEGKAEGVFNVKFKKELEDTYFAKDLDRERALQLVDNMNVLYVAMTRAKYGLKVIGKHKAPKKEEDQTRSNMADLLYAYTHGDLLRGEPYNPALIRRDQTGGSVALSYPSWPLGDVTSGESRLKVSTDAADFFAPDGAVGPKASQRLRGIVYHDILSGVRVPSDLDESVRAALGRGEISREDVPSVTALLREKIASVSARGWFPDDPSAIRNEVEILDGDGLLHRPDRVVVSGGGAIVIDYKFGEEKPSYRRQVARYKALLTSLGYAPVTGFLWYIRPEGTDIIEEVL